MPLYEIAKTGTFEPALLKAMGRGFEEALSALGLVDRSDPVTHLVAKKIIELAQAGEHDADRLRDAAIRAFSKSPIKKSPAVGSGSVREQAG